MVLEKGTRKSSTKGRHIKQINPLAKGQSCLTCRQRKVRCTAEKPACKACLRTARFEGRDLSTVECVYGAITSARGARTRGKGKAKEVAENDPELSNELPVTESEPLMVKRTMADLLNGSMGGEAAASTSFGSASEAATSYQAPSLPLSLDPTPWNAWPSFSDSTNSTPMFDGNPHAYTSTPPLTYSSASSPSETVVSSPPTPSASPAPSSFVHSVPYYPNPPSAYASKPLSHSTAYPYPSPYPQAQAYAQPHASNYGNNFDPFRPQSNGYSRESSHLQQQFSHSSSYSQSTWAPPPPLPLSSSLPSQARSNFVFPQSTSTSLNRSTPYPTSSFSYPSTYPPLDQPTIIPSSSSSFPSLTLPPFLAPPAPTRGYPLMPRSDPFVEYPSR
ncbi:Zn(II)2Cys6 transcription factor domain-containing protein [Sporobolomyces salmoneus]|uniref:Zn(II)2Cys6 transcription factor domain-containing protein n=1 Tax=Sporobolomyces salmoneus TaxID=183962 RepID=UPI0031715D0F